MPGGSLHGAVAAGGMALALMMPGHGAAWAAGASYPLDWAHRGEVLQYRSCGCADSCWVAEVKNQRTGQTLATLRCDCERLFSRVGAVRAAEVQRAPSCAAFEGDADKPEAIRKTLEQVLGR
jgi:hypothetical protein